jgi:DNA-binding NarL/FixJ family response regulator
MFSIMLVDDQPPILQGLTGLIESTNVARVVATETDGEAAIATALDKQPDLILLDVSLGGVSGVDVTRKLLSQLPDALVLAISAHVDSVYVRGMLDAGARGYMLKDNAPDEMADAIHTIMDGGQWIGKSLAYKPD